MTGLVALAQRQDGRRAERVQRRLRPGARRAGAQAGAGARLRDRRRGRRGRVPLHHLRPHRRQLHRARRVRPGPDPLRSRRPRRARSARSTWSRRPAARSPRRGAGEPACWPSRAAGCRSLAEALDSIDNLTIDPVDRSRFRVEVLQSALRGRASRRARTRRSPSRGGRRPSRPCATGSRRRTASWPATHPRREERVAPGRPGQRGAPMDAAMTSRPTDGPCPELRRPGRPQAEQFCEACGAELGAAAAAERHRAVDADRDADGRGTDRGRQHRRSVPASAAVRSPPTATAARAAPRHRSPRDHFTEQPAAWVAGVCDRGIRHARNEDAVALAPDAEPGSHAVLVVCDGVSNSTDSDVASLAAARAARDVLARSLPERHRDRQPHASRRRRRRSRRPPTRPTTPSSATPSTGPGNPASCTFVAAVVDGLAPRRGLGRRQPGVLAARTPASPVLLTVDDSLAAEQIAAGVPRAEAETGPQAHAITRWLGHRRPRPHAAHGARWTSPRPAGCWSAPTGCGTTARSRATLAGAGAGNRPTARAQSRSAWLPPWSTGPTPRAGRTTSL